MDKKKLLILTGSIVIVLLLITLLFLLPYLKKDNETYVVKTYPTSNGGTIYAADKNAQSVALNADGTSVSDALYEYKSKHGYSVQYNNKYIVDFGTNTYDFKVSNASNTVNVIIAPMEKQDAITNIQTKEDWDTLMSPMMGVESREFKRTPINNMEALVAHYNIDYGNGQMSDVLYVMFIGKNKIYNYMYNAAYGASESETTQIGAILYTIQEIQ